MPNVAGQEAEQLERLSMKTTPQRAIAPRGVDAVYGDQR
jgi:hypothetical protein